MTAANTSGLSLTDWLSRISDAKQAKDVLTVLEEFRKQNFSDEDRSKMAKHYVRILERLGGFPDTSAAQVEDEGPDGPVWYEKM